MSKITLKKMIAVFVAAIFAGMVHAQPLVVGTATADNVGLYEQVDFKPDMESPNETSTLSYRIINIGDKIWAHYTTTADISNNVWAAQLRNFGTEGNSANKEMQLKVRPAGTEAYTLHTPSDGTYYMLREGEESGVQFVPFVHFGANNNYTCGAVIDYTPNTVNNPTGDTEAPALTAFTATVGENDTIIFNFTATSNDDFFYYVKDEENGIEHVSFSNQMEIQGSPSTLYNFSAVAIDYDGNVSTESLTAQAETTFDPTSNLALYKPSFASSNDANAKLSNDGDNGTRWQADAADRDEENNPAEWWYVDLKGEFNLSKIQIRWEGAFAKKYKIQTALELPDDILSDEGWVTQNIEMSTMPGNGGEYEIVNANPARYVKIQTVERSGWPTSFYEFRVFASGRYAPVADPELTSITIEDAAVISGNKTPLVVLPKDQGGNLFEGAVVSVTVAPDDGGVIITQEEGVFYAQGVVADNYTLTASATYNDSEPVTDNAILTVTDAPRVQTITLNLETETENAYAAGRAVNLTISYTDQYGQPITAAPEWVVDGSAAGSVADNKYTPEFKGTATVKAKVGDVESDGLTFNVITDAPNVAQGKTVTAIEGSENPQNAVDGNFGSVWTFPNPNPPAENNMYDAWVIVDLGDEYFIELVEVAWEGAYSDTFTVDFAVTENDFTTKYNGSNSGGTVTKINKFYEDASTARYVRVYSTKAGSGYGTKIREVYVHGIDPGAVGLENPNGDNAISIYPNPATDVVMVSGEVSGLTIYSLTGQPVLKSTKSNVNVSGLSKGLYLISVTDMSGNTTTSKLQIR